MSKFNRVSGAAKLHKNTVRVFRMTYNGEICTLCGKSIAMGDDTVSVPLTIRQWNKTREYFHKNCFNEQRGKIE